MRSPSTRPSPSAPAALSNACWRSAESRPMRLIIEPIVRAALLEDLGRAGDITTDAVVPPEARIEAVITARTPGVIAGLEAALLAFELLDPGLDIEVLCPDGSLVGRGQKIARISGR